MSLKEFSIFSSHWWPFSLAEQKRLGNFGRGSYEDHLCEIILEFVRSWGDVVKILLFFSILTHTAILFGRAEGRSGSAWEFL